MGELHCSYGPAPKSLVFLSLFRSLLLDQHIRARRLSVVRQRPQSTATVRVGDERHDGRTTTAKEVQGGPCPR